MHATRNENAIHFIPLRISRSFHEVIAIPPPIILCLITSSSFFLFFFFSHLFPTVSIVKSGEKTETLTSHEFQVTSHFVAHNSSSARLIASCFEDIAGHRIMISRVARDSINSLSLSLSLKITFKNVEKQIRNYPKNYSRIDLRRRAERGR